MNDRELLELAAKAAGFGGPEHKFCWTESEYPRGSGKHGALWNYIGHMDTAVLWNPLTDDGDALRLAVKLRLLGLSSITSGEQWRIDYFAHGNDEVATTRRAIVRAAAEIGKGMK